MTERDKPRSAAEARPSEATAQARDDEIERMVGRAFAFGLPIASVITAVAVGAMAGMGSALLVLAAGALLGAIGLFWASVRTLSGDAPLPASFDTLSADRHGVDALVEEKLRLLRALKDLENEHELGKIDDADYKALLADYREQAKAVLRSMDVEVAPFREEAERLARDYLKKRSVPSPDEQAGPAKRSLRAERMACGACGASNEADAAFCKQCGASMKKEQPGAQP
jgi:hypothetical protein